jgi:hypothetical protein
MEFLDPKEQVINMEITPYGKYLLSIGKFLPAMYAFYDDDILYDAEYGGVINELQNNIETRIQEETPRLSAQAMFRSAEIGVFSNSPNIENDLMPGALADKTNKIKIQDTPVSEYVLQNPLGTSAYNSDKMPAWNIGFLKAELSSSYYALTGSKIPITFIPQLNCDIKYKLDIFPFDAASATGLVKESQDPFVTKEEVVFNDGSKIELQDDFIFLQVEEANTDFIKDNFTVEIFEVIDIPATDSSNFSKATNDLVLRKLYFNNNKFGTVDKDTVSYYFDILMDSKINPDEYCSLVQGKNKVENIFLDNTFICSPFSKGSSVAPDLYNTGENAETEDVC